MSDKDSDKTKVQNPASPPPGEDQTRIQHRPKHGSVSLSSASSTESISDDTTDHSISGDKTRLVPEDYKQEKALRQKQLRKLKQEKLVQDMIKQGKLRPPAQHISEHRASDVTVFSSAVERTDNNPRVPASNHSATANSIIATSSTPSNSANEVVLKERFLLEKVLGSGGMGVVYKAKDRLKVEAKDRDPYVAIKVLSEEFKAHPEAFISLQRESRKSQRIAHPNIVNVYDFDRDGDTVFMTMEFLDGHSLDQLIRQYKATGLPSDDAWEIIRGLSAALSHAHAENIIHSDFKPGNIFVTKKGATKVFDFGIARAVAKVEQQDENPEDKTVFDAGNLGALTPAYASLEMLEGKEPDIRDDLYALGCVAYELFTGEHPYNRLPANEAQKQGLVAKRINNIKKFQWLAIKKAIAFRREDRFESVDLFMLALTPKRKSSNTFLMATVILLVISIAGYFMFFNESADPYSEFDIRSELELKIKIDYLKEDLIAFISSGAFTAPWEAKVWKHVSDLVVLTKGGTPWLDEQKEKIYQLYLKQISAEIKAVQYNRAKMLIKNAQRYTDDTLYLQAQLNKVELTINQAERVKAEQERKNRDSIKNLQETNRVNEQKQVAQARLQSRQVGLFDVALDNVNIQTKCQGRLNMRNVEAAVNKLRGLDRSRYARLEPTIVDSLANCIRQTGKAFPERALQAKDHALRVFKSNKVLMALNIQSRDPCDISLAGLGSRGKRALCKDKIKDAGLGPVLVVIPGSSRIKAFAMGKFEVSVGELNKFCTVSSVCKPLKGDAQLPASKISFNVAKAYLKWLSRQSGQKYRLPTKNEWLYAAKSRRKQLDPNRNCMLRTRGIEKGGKLVKAKIGKQNSWGLVNYVGNVQEWAYDKGRKLVAVGGSYKQSMDLCTITTSDAHSGSADISTGLRVVRELRAGS